MYETAPQSPGSFPPQDLTGTRWNSNRLRPSSALHRCGLQIVFFVDGVLRHRLRIYEFTDRTECILRISKGWSKTTIELSDGTSVSPGDPLLELHLWNEHLRDRNDGDSHGLAWAIRLLRRVRFSLMLLAQHVDQDPVWKECKVVHARFVSSFRKPDRAIRHLGFSATSPPTSVGMKIHDFWENFLVYSLIWAFHPCRVNWRKRGLTRLELWLSKAYLQKLYGPEVVGPGGESAMKAD